MSFLCKADKSTPGSVAGIHKVARLHFHAPSSKRVDGHDTRAARARQGVRQSGSIPQVLSQVSGSKKIENWFVRALVGAGLCSSHALPPSSLCSASREFNPIAQKSRGDFRRLFSTARRLQHPVSCEAVSPPLFDQSQLLDLVDEYDTPYSAEHYARELYLSSPGPNLMVSNKPEDVEWPPQEYRWTKEGYIKEILQDLGKALRKRRHDPEDLYRMYRLLPAPRVTYLTARMRHRLLRNLGAVERKDERSMLRYLSVADDMKLNAIAMTVDEWNTATSFVARYMTRTTGVEVEAALQMFKEMERGAGIQANSATFNILFDAAAKAGKFHLAEIIYKEMENRGLVYNRFHHVSLIFYYGLRGDGDGVRQSYKTLVEAGEVVDTVVLNSVIASLIRAREPQAAMHVYERMVALYSQTSNCKLPARNYQEKREVDRALVKTARHARDKAQLLQTPRRHGIIAPDVRTYRILINCLAVHGGQLQATTKLLDDMSWFGLPIHGSIFLALFHGFANHGGEEYTHWTAARLESVWEAFMKSHHDENTNVYIGKWMVIWALRAFAKCAGLERTRQVWDELACQWTGGEEELDHVRKVLYSLTESRYDLS